MIRNSMPQGYTTNRSNYLYCGHNANSITTQKRVDDNHENYRFFPSESVAVGEGRYANGVLLHPSSAAGRKIILGASALCGIFPPLRCRRAPGFFPRQPTHSGIRPHDIFDNFLHDGNV